MEGPTPQRSSAQPAMPQPEPDVPLIPEPEPEITCLSCINELDSYHDYDEGCYFTCCITYGFR